jgi:hypothetical protein
MTIRAQQGPLGTLRAKGKSAAFEENLLLSAIDVHQLTGIPISTLKRWRYSGRGPSYSKLEGSVRYYMNDVLKYVAQGRKSSVRASIEERRKCH